MCMYSHIHLYCCVCTLTPTVHVGVLHTYICIYLYIYISKYTYIYLYICLTLAIFIMCCNFQRYKHVQPGNTWVQTKYNNPKIATDLGLLHTHTHTDFTPQDWVGRWKIKTCIHIPLTLLPFCFSQDLQPLLFLLVHKL